MHRWDFGDVMTRDVAHVRLDTPHRKILNTLLDRRVSAAPVVDGDGPSGSSAAPPAWSMSSIISPGNTMPSRSVGDRPQGPDNDCLVSMDSRLAS